MLRPPHALVLLSALILMIADICTASRSPVVSPTYPPTTNTPVAAPSPDDIISEFFAPGPSAIGIGKDCASLLLGIGECITYVEVGSNLTAPDKACCPELATLVCTNAVCLCEMLNPSGNIFNLPIDLSRALSLPAACKVITPDPALCSLKNFDPTGAPASSSSPAVDMLLGTDDDVSPTGEALPPSDATVICSSTTSLFVALVAVAAFTWNMF